MRQNAIVIFQGVEATSPFGAWMEILRRRLGDDVETLEGTFTRFPLVPIVIDGLLLIVRAVSARCELSLSSADQVRLEVMPYVNRLVNTGLVLAYPSMEEAVDAFEHTVVQPILHGNTEWAKLAAKYFAALVKRAREEGERLACFERDMEELERSTARFAGAKLLDDECMHLLVQDAEWLAWHGMGMHRAGDGFLGASEEYVAACVQKALFALHDLERRAQALLALPFDLRPLRREIKSIERGSSVPSIEQHWVETQLWLVLLEAPPSAQIISYAELLEAMPLRSGVSDDELVERFFARMEARGARLAQPHRDVLERRLRQRVIPTLRARPDTVSVKVAQEIFLNVSIDDLVRTHESALLALQGDATSILDLLDQLAVRQLKEGLEESDLRAELLNRVDWKLLSAAQIQRLVVRKTMSEEYLVSNWAWMNVQDVRRVVRWMIQTERLSLQAATVFAYDQILEVDLRFYIEHTNITPIAARADLFRGVLYGFETGDSDVSSLSHGKLVDLAVSVPEAELRALVEEENDRERWIAFVDNLITSADMKAHGKDAVLRDALGVEAFARLVLAEELRMRYTRYTVKRGEDDFGVYEPPWGMWKDYDLLSKPAELFGSERAADEAYETFPETDALHWYVQCPSVGDAFGGKYWVAREKYYRRFRGRKKRPVVDTSD